MQINAAGDLCAICQVKMQAPIFLSCKHIFCEDCVAEWLAYLHFLTLATRFMKILYVFPFFSFGT